VHTVRAGGVCCFTPRPSGHDPHPPAQPVHGPGMRLFGALHDAVPALELRHADTGAGTIPFAPEGAEPPRRPPAPHTWPLGLLRLAPLEPCPRLCCVGLHGVEGPGVGWACMRMRAPGEYHRPVNNHVARIVTSAR